MNSTYHLVHISTSDFKFSDHNSSIKETCQHITPPFMLYWVLNTYTLWFAIKSYSQSPFSTVFVLCDAIWPRLTLQKWIRPYASESTGSRPISEVKLMTAQSVLWWETTREYCVLYSFQFFTTITTPQHAARHAYMFIPCSVTLLLNYVSVKRPVRLFSRWVACHQLPPARFALVVYVFSPRQLFDNSNWHGQSLHT